MCRHPDCDIISSFGYETDGKKLCCKNHKDIDMINLTQTKKKCRHQGCRINLTQTKKKCRYPECNLHADFGYHDKLCCKNHKDIDMVNLEQKKKYRYPDCISATFGYETVGI